MTDEINEILEKLEIVARKHTIEVCEDGSKIETMPANVVDELRLNNYSAKLLLDYITTLQEENAKLIKENERLNNIIKEVREYINMKEVTITYRELGLLPMRVNEEVLEMLQGGDNNGNN